MQIDVRDSAKNYVKKMGPKKPEYLISYEVLVDCLTNFGTALIDTQKMLMTPKPVAHRGITVKTSRD